VFCENSSHLWKAGGTFWSPVGRPVLATMSRSKRSGVVDEHADADEPAPVLAEQRRGLVDAQPAEPAVHDVDVELVGVILPVVELVRLAEADQVGREAAEARFTRTGIILR
jgi:hypothetical protein